MSLFSWWNSLWNVVGSFVKRAWVLASPFLKEMLSASAKKAIEILQELALEAIKKVAEQKFATDEEKCKAFASIMFEGAKSKGVELKDFELNLLRETAYAIWKKSKEQ